MIEVVAVGLASSGDKGNCKLSREVREDKTPWLSFQRIH